MPAWGPAERARAPVGLVPEWGLELAAPALALGAAEPMLERAEPEAGVSAALALEQGAAEPVLERAEPEAEVSGRARAAVERFRHTEPRLRGTQ